MGGGGGAAVVLHNVGIAGADRLDRGAGLQSGAASSAGGAHADMNFRHVRAVGVGGGKKSSGGAAAGSSTRGRSVLPKSGPSRKSDRPVAPKRRLGEDSDADNDDDLDEQPKPAKRWRPQKPRVIKLENGGRLIPVNEEDVRVGMELHVRYFGDVRPNLRETTSSSLLKCWLLS